MKAKIMRGGDFLGCSDYILDDEKNAEILGGNLSGVTAGDMAEELNAFAKQRPDIEKPVWHSSLSAVIGEKLSDEKWNEVAQDYMKGLGFDLNKTPYIIVKHHDKPYEHIHIQACRVGIDRSLYLGRNENLKATKISQQLEKKHGLTRTKGPGYDPLTGKIIRQENSKSKSLTPGERKMSKRNGAIPPRQRLQEIITAAVKGRPTLAEFENRLTDAGVKFKLSSNGYSYQLDGVPFKGSQLGTAFKWAQLKKQFISEEQAELQSLYAARRVAGEIEERRRSKYRANRSVFRSICQISYAVLPRPLGQAVQVAVEIISIVSKINDWCEANIYRDQVKELTALMNQIKAEQLAAKVSQKAKPSPLHIVAELQPPKSAPVPVSETKVKRIQEVILTPDTAMFNDSDQLRDDRYTTIYRSVYSSPVVAAVPTQSEALPPQDKNKPSSQQPVSDVPPNYSALSAYERLKHSQYIEDMQKNYPAAKIENLNKLCTIARDIKKLTIQNTNGTLSNEKYNSFTDHLEMQIKELTKALPSGVKIELPYAQEQPAITINGQPVPEIAKSQFIQPQLPGAPTQGLTRTGGRR